LCRENYSEQQKDVPCEVDQICSKTKNHIQDEQEWMDVDRIINHVIYFYDLISGIGDWQEFKKYGKDQTEVFKFKSLDKIDFVLDQFQFPYDGIDKMTMINYISLFHQSYVSGVIGGN
jgi:hypothetical protein